ncbi:MAG: Fic family protein [Tunicatimonas sp.]
MLVNTIALQEAKASTAIENIFTTEDELYKAVSDTVQEEKADPATKEVLRYREALWAGYQSMKDRGTIDMPLIVKIFQQIKNTTADLRPPQAQVVIKRGQSEFRSGEIIYTPPRGADIVEALMQNLITYLSNTSDDPTDPLLKMCIAHYQFEAIHPFQDGNGRSGRILNLFYLVQSGLLSQPTLYLSKYIITHKEDYYYHLGAVTQRGGWKQWILFMLDAVEQTAGLTNRLINEILDQMEATLAHGKATIKWYNKEVNEAIFSQPYAKPSVVGDRLEKSSRTTLTRYMEALVQQRILIPKKDGRAIYYLNEDLIRILEG